MGRGGEQSLPSTSGYDHLPEVPSAGFQEDPQASVLCRHALISLPRECKAYSLNLDMMTLAAPIRSGTWLW